MIKTRVIGAADVAVFETAVNEFIKDKKVIDIKYQSILLPKQYSNGVPSRMAMADRALIIYEEENE